MEHSLLVDTLIFFAAAVFAVPITRRLGLGAVLGYLLAGIGIGPWGLALVTDVDRILHFAELGVVLLLFLIGLELQPARLWTMRRVIAGLGVGQLLITSAVLALLLSALDLPWSSLLILAVALALSSTAFALQVLAENNQLTTQHGRSAFAILLLQDLAVIPVLVAVPLLATHGDVGSLASAWNDAAVAVLAVMALVIAGRYLLRYALRTVARTQIREIFLAMALLTVLGAAAALDQVGLSMGLGAFLAGVLLADSEYRHALEADIEPLKGLLLGLFFMAVGMSVNIGLIVETPVSLLALTMSMLVLKAGVLFALGLAQGLERASAILLAASLPQGGEFAFVILSAAVAANLLEPNISEIAIMVVTLSMLVSPVIFKLAKRATTGRVPIPEDYDEPRKGRGHVIIAGFGRVGQIVGRILNAKELGFTALESNPDQVDFVRKYGNKVYYGDAGQVALLESAGAENAAAFVLAIGDTEQSMRVARTVRHYYPQLPLYARAQNRKHAYLLMDLGVELIERETLHSSLQLTRRLLEGLGYSAEESGHAVETFRRYDERRLYESHEHHTDEERLIYLAKRQAEELEEVFREDTLSEIAGE